MTPLFRKHYKHTNRKFIKMDLATLNNVGVLFDLISENVGSVTNSKRIFI